MDSFFNDPNTFLSSCGSSANGVDMWAEFLDVTRVAFILFGTVSGVWEFSPDACAVKENYVNFWTGEYPGSPAAPVTQPNHLACKNVFISHPIAGSCPFGPDVTPPDIAITAPAGGAAYLLNETVSADYACSDTESGVAICAGDVAVGAPLDTSTVDAHTVTVYSTDNAGNATSVTAAYQVQDEASDTTLPTVLITTPQDGARYKRDQPVLAAYSCTDTESGIASGCGDVANGSPIDTSSRGSKTFSITGTDNAGNATTVTVTYKVRGKRWR